MARKYLKMGLFSPPRYSIFSGDHGLLVFSVFLSLFFFLFFLLFFFLLFFILFSVSKVPGVLCFFMLVTLICLINGWEANNRPDLGKSEK